MEDQKKSIVKNKEYFLKAFVSLANYESLYENRVKWLKKLIKLEQDLVHSMVGKILTEEEFVLLYSVVNLLQRMYENIRELNRFKELDMIVGEIEEIKES